MRFYRRLSAHTTRHVISIVVHPQEDPPWTLPARFYILTNFLSWVPKGPGIAVTPSVRFPVEYV